MYQPNLPAVFENIVMPGERTLQRIEDYGAYVDMERLREVKVRYIDEATRLEAELKAMLPRSVDWDVNWNSPQQVADVLFKHCGLKSLTKTDSGKDSTGKGVLLRLVDKHPIPRTLLDLRKYNKAINGFLNPWQQYLEYELRHGREPRLHTTYNIARTNTGRLSAEDPNLQQVARDKEIRSLICAPPGKVIIEADYSQIELRIAAFIARAYSMLRIYKTGGDIHTTTGCSIARVDPEDLTKEQRTRAKAVNFGFIFGMWWKTFKAYAFDSYGVVVTDAEAEDFRKMFFLHFPELEGWHNRAKNEARRDAQVVTPVGRIRYLPNVESTDKDLRGKAERQAINTPVQSTASDMLVMAMSIVDAEVESKFHARIIGEVHDALLIECPEEWATNCGKYVKHVMEGVVPYKLKAIFGVDLDVPIIADVSISGAGWGVGKALEFGA